MNRNTQYKVKKQIMKLQLTVGRLQEPLKKVLIGLKILSKFLVIKISLIFIKVFYLIKNYMIKLLSYIRTGYITIKINYQIQHSNIIYDKIMEKKNINDFEIYLNAQIKRLSNVIHVNIGQYKELIEFDKLKQLVLDNEYHHYIEELVKRKNFDRAYRFMLAFQYDKISFQQLLDQIPENQYVLASKIIKEMNIDVQRYPKILEKLREDSINYIIERSELPLDKIEELFMNDKEMLLYLYKYLYRVKKKKALLLAKRQNLQINNPEIDELIQKQEFIENPLFQYDSFQPTQQILSRDIKLNFLSLNDLGIEEKDVVLIQNQEQFTEQIRSEILNQDKVGLDTEFSSQIPETKFSNKKRQLGLLQIATIKNVYILDMLNLESSHDYKEFLLNLVESQNIKKIGQGIQQDIILLISKLKLKNNIKHNNLVDLSTIFKSKFQNEVKSSLAHQCQKVFHKELDKTEQISNWHLRPLRKAQIHYAALDAYVSLKLYDELEKL